MDTGISRREWIAGAAAGISFLAQPAHGSVANEDALDAALREIHASEPELKQGLSTHAPMVAEALSALDRGAEALPWIRGRRAPVLRLPGPSQRIVPEQWRAALGPRLGAASWESANHRWADWMEFFTAGLAAAHWREVLDRWVSRLAPGMSGAATHGVIRTAHAVRAIGRRENAVRRGELARGLAYWASSYEELPAGSERKPSASFTSALAAVPLYTEAFGKSPDGRNIVEVLRQLKQLDGFGDVRSLIAEPKDVAAALSALTATFARVFVRHGVRHDTIAFVHAVTGPAALRRMSPYIRPETARAAFPHAWHTAAAIYAAYARRGDAAGSEQTNRTPAELIEAAVKDGDDHAIKFTEVMAAEYAVNPDPIYLAAAEAATKAL